MDMPVQPQTVSACAPPNQRRLVNLLGALSIGIGDRLREMTEAILANEGAGPAAVTAIGHHPGLGVQALSTILGLSHPGTVRLVDTLEGRGLVVRARSQTDARAVELTLTPAGLAMRAEMLGRREAEIWSFLDQLAPAELGVLENLVERVLTRIPRQVVECDTICRFCDEAACLQCPFEAVEARG